MERGKNVSSKFLAGALNCCTGNTTRKRQAAEQVVQKLLEDPRWLARSQRADRVTESLWRRLHNLARLVAADPAGSRRWIRRLVESALAPRKRK